jgi:very-long-chain ceramide synthase
MIKYIDISQTLCDFTFGCFLLSWLLTRHVAFIRVIWSAIFDVPKVLPFVWDPETGSYLTYGSLMMFILCLLALQVSCALYSDIF